MNRKTKILFISSAFLISSVVLLACLFYSKSEIQKEKDHPVSIYTADDGVIKIQADKGDEKTIEEIWEDPVDFSGFTLPQKAQMIDGSLGVLEIDSIGLSVNIYEAENEIEAMEKGVAHFKNTSAWEGNIGLCSHNATMSGSGAFFRNLNQVSLGDSLTYETALGKRTYAVSQILTIPASDWSYLERTDENQITLITCVSGQENIRYCVIAKEIIH